MLPVGPVWASTEIWPISYNCDFDRYTSVIARDKAMGDISGMVLANSNFLMVTKYPEGIIGLFKSIDEGKTWTYQGLIMTGKWSGAAAYGNEVYVTSSYNGFPKSVNFKTSADGGNTWGKLVEIYSADNLLIDTRVIRLTDGALLAAFTEVEGNTSTGVYTVIIYKSTDRGNTWSRLSSPVKGPKNVNIEDPKFVQLDSGDLLLAYEYEEKDGGYSHLYQQRSTDFGATWEPATNLWDDGTDADVEPGGYLRFSDRELWFVASTDEDDNPEFRSFTEAKIKRRLSRDGGRTWGAVATLLNFSDHQVMDSVILPGNRVGLFDVRFSKSGIKTAYFYVIEKTAINLGEKVDYLRLNNLWIENFRPKRKSFNSKLCPAF